MINTRRQFIKDSGVIALGFSGLQKLSANYAEKPSLRDKGYGPLIVDPKKILDLPKGFSYRVISRAGDAMNDGLVLPGKPDGMATFPGPNGLTILIRNR